MFHVLLICRFLPAHARARTRAGAMFNVLLPEYITNIILALLVTPTMWRMGVQAARLHRAEAAAKREAAEALTALSDKAMQVGGRAGP